MAKSSTAKTKRRVVFIFLITLLVVGFVASNVAKIWFQIIDQNKEKIFLKKQLSKMENEEQYLKTEVQKLQDPDYVARYAREKYLYSKDGEFTIRIP